MCISDEVTCESSLKLATLFLVVHQRAQMLLLFICRFKQDLVVLEAITGVSRLKMLFQISVCHYYFSVFKRVLKRSPIGKRAISAFRGQKSCTRIIYVKHVKLLFAFSDS